MEPQAAAAPQGGAPGSQIACLDPDACPQDRGEQPGVPRRVACSLQNQQWSDPGPLLDSLFWEGKPARRLMLQRLSGSSAAPPSWPSTVATPSAESPRAQVSITAAPLLAEG